MELQFIDCLFKPGYMHGVDLHFDSPTSILMDIMTDFPEANHHRNPLSCHSTVSPQLHCTGLPSGKLKRETQGRGARICA